MKPSPGMRRRWAICSGNLNNRTELAAIPTEEVDVTPTLPWRVPFPDLWTVRYPVAVLQRWSAYISLENVLDFHMNLDVVPVHRASILTSVAYSFLPEGLKPV